MSDELTKSIEQATSHDAISAALDAARQETVAIREPRATKVEPEPTTFTCTEEINGKIFTFEADSQSELDSMVANAYRVATAVQPEPVPVQEPTVDLAKEAAARAELEVQFRSGQISAKDYLERSGAVAEYLEKEGVPVEELKATVAQNRQREEIQSWADATQAFLNSPAGADWPGGDRNKNLIGMQIAALGLVDAEDKVAALAQAYASMKANGMIFEQSEGSEPSRARDTAQSASVRQTPTRTSVAHQEPARQTTQRRTSSSLFGASSGTSVNDMQDSSKDTPQFKIDSNASPQEIIEHWKQEQFRRGIDPNAAFAEAFSGRR